MNAYFTASIVGKKFHNANYQKIIDILIAKGVNLQYEHIMKGTEDSIRMQTKTERLAFQAKLENWINSSDFLIVESTFPSISVGWEISLGIHRGKPVLILYSEGDPPSLLSNHLDEKIICEKYTPDTLESTISDFINYVEGNADMRFTFFISSKIASHLDKVARKQRIPKSVYLRNLIELDIQNNQ
jgi:2'-deoxynucleoside 5'-phosphate N-hydrolase